jgi:hypothetical protein
MAFNNLCYNQNYTTWGSVTTDFHSVTYCSTQWCPNNYGPSCASCPCPAPQMCSSGLTGTGLCTTHDQAVLTTYYNNLSVRPAWNTNITLCSQIGVNCSNASVVSLTLSSVTGPLGSEIGQLASLSILSLTSSDIVGSLPTELGLLSNLASLTVKNTLVSGSIPVEITQIPTFKYLQAVLFSPPLPFPCCAHEVNDLIVWYCF